MSNIVDGRLSSVAKFVRWGARFADVGTDHAYLPLFLLKEGIIDRAVCSDINEGPLANARATAAEFGVYDKIDFVLTDGAAALSEYGITDMAICGMGGELIAEIIEAAPFIKENKIRLILQPMTRQEHLREYLYLGGFSLVGEDYVSAGGKNYSIIVAEYSGVIPTDKPSAVIRYGTACEKSTAAQREYLCSKLRSKRAALSGIAKSGRRDEQLCGDIEYIERLLSEL